MSRADRRKAGIAEKPKTYVMTDAQLKKIKDDAKKEMFLTALCIPILVLHDKFNFTEDQFSDFIASCLTWMKCVDDGDVKMSEIVEECEKLANIKIDKKEVRHANRGSANPVPCQWRGPALCDIRAGVPAPLPWMPKP